jgi:peptidoglycan-N-acetylglucosamine deacetylase
VNSASTPAARAVLTTSWDDGHPLDLRVAELLAKYELTGTFYVPAKGPGSKLSPSQLVEMSSTFEIGSHTVNEVKLTTLTDDEVRRELVGSRSWLEDLTGKPCVAFSPVGGKFASRHLTLVQQAGYLSMRTVELLSLDFPRRRKNLWLMPTTLQVRDHTSRVYLRNIAKRMAMRSLVRLAVTGPRKSWLQLAESLLDRVAEHGGVFHLWGHGWEIDALGEWNRLEELMALMGALRPRVACLTNSGLCRAMVRTNEDAMQDDWRALTSDDDQARPA